MGLTEAVSAMLARARGAVAQPARPDAVVAAVVQYLHLCISLGFPPPRLRKLPRTYRPNLGERLASRNGSMPVKLLAVPVNGSVSKRVRFRTLPVKTSTKPH